MGLTSIVIIRFARARFGFAERPAIWFWRAFERGVANDNNPKMDLF